MNELDILCVCAERYALGRRTYVVGEVCGIIRSHINDISTKTLHIIINDIQGANDYGMEMDRNDWFSLLKDLRIEREARERVEKEK